MKTNKLIIGFFSALLTHLKSSFFYLGINTALLLANMFYVLFRFEYLNLEIPFWYVLPWGTDQLASKNLLYIFPIAVFIIGTLGFIGAKFAKNYYVRYGPEIIKFVGLSSNIILTYSLLRIISISSKPYEPVINPVYLNLLFAAALGFVIVYFVTPIFIDFAKKKGIITNPQSHLHPGMVLTRPSARGGGVVFLIGMLGASALFVKPSLEIIGIYIGAAILALIGLLDDYQNTHPKSQISIIEAPGLRLFILLMVVLIVTMFGLRIDYIGDLTGGLIRFDFISWNYFGMILKPLSVGITILWVVWLLNLLSWSNGIDAQYCGIIGIASLITGFLALRFVPLSSENMNLAVLMFVCAGASFGLLPFNWHPSKIMWGFGAMSAGLIVCTGSILIGSKISTTILVLLVPFMDALVTFVRRVVQKKNPLRGDKGHLHHLLLLRGWNHKQIALFYWSTTLVFGIIGLIASELVLVQTTLILAGIVAGIIVVTNLATTK